MPADPWLVCPAAANQPQSELGASIASARGIAQGTCHVLKRIFIALWGLKHEIEFGGPGGYGARSTFLEAASRFGWVLIALHVRVLVGRPLPELDRVETPVARVAGGSFGHWTQPCIWPQACPRPPDPPWPRPTCHCPFVAECRFFRHLLLQFGTKATQNKTENPPNGHSRYQIRQPLKHAGPL